MSRDKQSTAATDPQSLAWAIGEQTRGEERMLRPYDEEVMVRLPFVQWMHVVSWLSLVTLIHVEKPEVTKWAMRVFAGRGIEN